MKNKDADKSEKNKTNTKKKIELGCQVEMHFRITLENDFVADDSFAEEPLVFKSGDGTIVPALDDFLIGLAAEDEGQLILNPDQGFGFSDETMIYKIPKSEFSADALSKDGGLDKGHIIGFVTPSGEEVPGTILAVEENQLTIDFNHPFAGHVVTFDIKILSVNCG